jgi:hypothetical protein
LGYHKAMSLLNSSILAIATILAVYWEGAFNGLRHLLGAQVDLLPALVVYASLYGGLGTVAMVAAGGGLLFDSISANPLGISVIPLFCCGLATHGARDLILREQTYAQAALGFAASLINPLFVLLLLLTTRHQPLFGWGTLWEFIVMGIGGAIATPVVFELFSLLNRWFGHAAPSTTSFRPDREIRRGRM